jgi:hypothetical protein
MNDTSERPMGLPKESTPNDLPNRGEPVPFVVRNREDADLLWTTTIQAIKSEASFAYFATQPSESSSSTDLPLGGPPSTLRPSLGTSNCALHWWKATQKTTPECTCPDSPEETSRGKIESPTENAGETNDTPLRVYYDPDGPRLRHQP